MPADVAADVPAYLPPDPRRLLVLAPGHPWPDGSRTDDQLREYAHSALLRWQGFADRHGTVLVVPILGARFPDFREGGDAAEYVTALANTSIDRHLPGSYDRFSLHGHSAGAQFAARYLVTHAERLSDVVLSAPSEYAFPDPALAWPHGASGAPAGADWIAAGRDVRVTVLVGTADIEARPSAPGHASTTRVGRARSWVTAMQQYALESGQPSVVALRLVDGVAHDEMAMTPAAMHAFTDHWH